MPESKDSAKDLARVLRMLADGIEKKPELLKDLGLGEVAIVVERGKIAQRPIDVDVFGVFSQGGEKALRDRLNSLELNALRRIVRLHGLDPSKLAEKWKNKDRLVNLIIERVSVRSDKGKAFKDYGFSKPT
jgi:hypothetical protein